MNEVCEDITELTLGPLVSTTALDVAILICGGRSTCCRSSQGFEFEVQNFRP